MRKLDHYLEYSGSGDIENICYTLEGEQDIIYSEVYYPEDNIYEYLEDLPIYSRSKK